MRAVILPVVVLLLPAAGATESGDEILRRAIASESAQQVLREQYSYRQHIENLVSDKNGSPGKVVQTRDYDIVFLEGKPYRRMVQVNGKPLSAKELQKQQEHMRRTASERREERKHVEKGVKVGDGGLSDMLRLMKNTLVREEELGGRKAWVVACEPGKDAAAASPEDARILCYRHLYWIDEEDLVVARHEYEVIREGIGVKTGTNSKVVFAKDAGSPWFTRRVEGEFFTKGFPEHHFFEHHVFTDFKKFDVSTTIQFEKDEPK